MTPQTDRASDTTNVLRTDQVAPHADLAKVVQHHQQNPWRKPCPQHTQVAFEQFLARYQSQPRPLILDSFCGTGMSTALLAEKHPDKWVVGIDQSAHRLAKHPHSLAENCLLLRAEAEPFWQCLTEAGIPYTPTGSSTPTLGPRPRNLNAGFMGMAPFPCWPVSGLAGVAHQLGYLCSGVRRGRRADRVRRSSRRLHTGGAHDAF